MAAESDRTARDLLVEALQTETRVFAVASNWPAVNLEDNSPRALTGPVPLPSDACWRLAVTYETALGQVEVDGARYKVAGNVKLDDLLLEVSEGQGVHHQTRKKLERLEVVVGALAELLAAEVPDLVRGERVNNSAIARTVAAHLDLARPGATNELLSVEKLAELVGTCRERKRSLLDNCSES